MSEGQTISNVQHFTLESIDEKHYNRIQVTLPSMCFNNKVNFNVSQLLTNCNIRVLNERDYLRMKIDGVIKALWCTKRLLLDKWIKNVTIA